MSLTVDGVWKSGVWAFTVWADGVWFEGGGAPPAPPAALAPLVGGGYHPSQGLYPRPPGRKEVSRARERLGLKDRIAEERAAKVIAEIAARQAESLERDEQKRFEELARQLEIEGLEFDARYLEALNQEREHLIDLEIARRLRAIRGQEEILLMLLIAAAAV